jgi:hypothetical protein
MSGTRRHGKNGLRSYGAPVFLGVLLAGVGVMILEASTSYDEDCGWGFGWRTEITGNQDRTRMVSGHGRCRFEVEVAGEVEIAPDARGIERLGPGAKLEIEERVRGERRRLEARPGPDGEPELAWFVDRRPAEPSEASRDWLARSLLRFYRTSGWGAAGRVGDLLDRGGPEAVLAELDELRNDRVERLYLEALLVQTDLDPPALAEALTAAGERLGSDHELGKVLRAVPASSLAAPEPRAAYLRAAASIGSDFELRRTLAALLADPGLADPEVAPAVADVVLEAASGIGSDFELAELLETLASAYPPALPLPLGYAGALRSIGSDFEHRRALVAAVERPGISAESLGELLATTDQLGSDFEQAEALIAVADRLPADGFSERFFGLLEHVGADFEHRKVLTAVAERPDLPPETLAAVLDSSRSIGSDFEQAELLVAVVRHHPEVAGLESELEAALATIGSEHEREKVRQAL